jgi:predicted metalloprotease
MRWQLGRRSTNVIDRRSAGPVRGFGGPVKVSGCGLLVVLGLALVVWIAGGDPMALLGGSSPAGDPAMPAPAGDAQADFVSVVLADTEDTWGEIFAERGATYEPPRLVLFRDAVQSSCGYGTAAVGPFYCPVDRMVYLDLSFFDELERRFGAPGDFARAYVIGHEVGHHVQTITGIDDRMRSRHGYSDNELSVRQELQADCYAGVWAHRAERERDLLEPGDLEEGLRAATAIGDDTLQRRSGGAVVPETFTHGSSEQRVEWFRRGFESGRMESCDTFAVASL